MALSKAHLTASSAVSIRVTTSPVSRTAGVSMIEPKASQASSAPTSTIMTRFEPAMTLVVVVVVVVLLIAVSKFWLTTTSTVCRRCTTESIFVAAFAKRTFQTSLAETSSATPIARHFLCENGCGGQGQVDCDTHIC